MTVYKFWASRKPTLKISDLHAEPDKIYLDSATDQFYIGDESGVPLLIGGGKPKVVVVNMPTTGTSCVVPSADHGLKWVFECWVNNPSEQRVETVININTTTVSISIDSNVSLVNHTLVLTGM